MRFKIDDSAITGNGFTCCDTYPTEFIGNTLTVSATSPLCVKSYSERQGNGHFSVTFGQYFGRDWVHLISSPSWRFSWSGLQDLLIRGPEYAQSMSDVFSRADPHRRIKVYHGHLPGSACIVRVSHIAWERSKIGLRIEVWEDSGHIGLNEWKILDIEVGGFLMYMYYHYDHS